MRAIQFTLVYALTALFLSLTLNSSGTVFAENEAPLISDERFLFTSSFNGFDVEFFLKERKSGLANLKVLHSGRMFSVAEVITFYARYYSINPQVLLAFLELRTGLVSKPNLPAPNVLDNVFGYADKQGFAAQIERLGEELTNAYYSRQDGSISVEAPNSSTHALRYVLSGFGSKDNDKTRLVESFSNMFGDPRLGTLAYDDDTEVGPEGPPPPTFLLPWQAGHTWYYTGGPHYWGSTGPRSSVDFSPGPVGNSGCDWTSNEQILPAATGKVLYAANNLVTIHHNPNIFVPAWQTQYYHVRAIQVSEDQLVNSSTNLGYPSCEAGLGGTANGVHQHFSFLYDGYYRKARNKILSGWTIKNSPGLYQGTMIKGGVTKTADVVKSDTNALTR